MVNDVSSMPGWVIPLAIGLGLWSAIWKGLALYKAGMLRQPLWFVVMFIVNTAGILEIFYIFVFSKMVKPAKEPKVSEQDATESH